MAFSLIMDPNETPESARRKRKIAEALMGQLQQTPTTYGGGINALLTGFAAKMAGNKADAADAYGARQAEGSMSNISAAMGGEFPTAPGGADPQSSASNGEMPVHRRALLNTISGPESGGDYNVIYGGGQFDDYSDHPRRAVPIASGPNKGKTSSAAGKYQFLGSTWDQYRDKLGLKDFSPGSQDVAAWELASDTFRQATGGDLDQVLQSGDADAIANVGKVLNGVWTSLPGGIEQGTNTDRFLSAFQRNLSGGAGQDRVQGSVGEDPMGGVEGVYRGGPYNGPSHDPAMNAQVQDAPMNYRTLPTQNVPPTTEGMQNPRFQAIAQALMSNSPMGGAPQRFQQPNASPAVQNIAQALMGKQQPQQQPVQMAQAQGLPEMAGNQIVTRDAMGGPSMQMLMEAANNPWLDDNQRGTVNGLIDQQMRRQQADYQRQQEMADPRYQIGLDADRLAVEKGRYELDQSRRKRNLVETKDGIYDADTGEWITNPSAPAENAETGLNPQLMRDKDGNLFYGQPTKDGRILRSAVEDGSVPVGPGDKAYETTVGKASGEAAAGIPAAQGIADQVTLQIDELLNDTYLDSMLGSVQGRLPNFSSDAARVQGKMDQLQGGAFLQARQLLKGGGQITDFEGKKAEAAMARLYTAQNETDYREALNDFKDAVQVGLAKLQQTSQLGRPQMTGGRVPSGAGNVPPAAVDMLRSDPSLAGQFDAKYGPGTAARILGGQ